ncbi:MAG: sensor domain-containing diguanylate cyclase [Alphaproteobacteria bacterium]|nr:sensor domain-containing diguanylate cyclase [Alphaproteobacteria bacterium]
MNLPACLESGTFGLSATHLLRSHPGPALLVRGASVLESNGLAQPIASAITEGAPENLTRAIADTARDRGTRQVRVLLSERDGGAAHDLTVLALNTPADTVLILGREVTLERNLTQALLASRELFKDLVNCSSDFAWETGADGRFRFVSPKGALGHAAAELVGRPASEFLSDPNGPMPFETDIPLEGVEVRLRNRHGEELCFEACAIPVIGRHGTRIAVRGVCRDVTAAREREAELARAHALLERQSRADDLTGLLNRRAFIEDVRRRMSHVARHGREAVLMFVDLDNFKSINDHLGHQKGDEALCHFAEALERTSRAGDIVARLGGDEFVLWLEDTGESGARVKAQNLARLATELGERFPTPGRPIGLSVGIVVTGGHDKIETLIERADEAMYGVKRSGKGDCAVTRAA